MTTEPVAGFIPRAAAAGIHAALADTRVVVITGARQVGKSTLARHVLARSSGALERRLDDPATLQFALDDPVAFVRHDGPLLIDEVQRAPQLLLAIKQEVDLDPRPGRFLLTGSADLLAMRRLPDTLASRAQYVDLWPLAQREIDRRGGSTVLRLLDGDVPGVCEPCDRHSILQRAVRGGYPEAVSRPSAERRRSLHASIVRTVTQRDIVDLSRIEQPRSAARLLRALAARMAQPLAIQPIAAGLKLPRTTVERYIALLEQLYLVRRIPAWSSSLTKRLVRRPKLVFVDSGLGAHLLAQDVGRLASPTGASGPLIESFCLSELARDIDYAGVGAELMHYRDRDGIEVDAVIEAFDGRVVAVEVKAAETIAPRDVRGLRHLQARCPRGAFQLGVVLYCGSDVRQLAERIWALPISCLWTE